MPKRPPTKNRLDSAEDSPAYLADWASRLSESLSPNELGRLASDYARLARNASLSPDDRKFARRRSAAIRKIM